MLKTKNILAIFILVTTFLNILFSDSKDLFELSAIVPRYAKLGDTVVLKCNHTVADNQLDKVQWTKSGYKLFQYIRNRTPPYINYTIPGAKIDVSISLWT